MARLATPEDLQGALPIEAAPAPAPKGPRKATPEDLANIRPLDSRVNPPEPEPDPGVGKRLLKRFLGTDVDDPLEFERLGAIIAFSLGGAKAGGSAGLAVGGPVGGAVGAAVGSVAGAAAGAAFPERRLDVLEMFGVEGASDRGLSTEDQRRVIEGEALLEAATLGTLGAARLGARAAIRGATGVTKAGEQLAEQAAKQGIELAPVIVGERAFGKHVINVLGRFPFIGSAARRTVTAADKAVAEALNQLPDRLAPLITISPENLGFRILKDAKNLFTEVTGELGKRYDDLLLRAKRAGVVVQPKGTRAVVDTTLEALEELGTTAGGEARSASQAAEIAKDFLKKEMVGLDDLTLAQADDLLKKIEQTIRTSDKGVQKQVAEKLFAVHGALKNDVLHNMVGTNADKISRLQSALDSEFTNKMQTLFETATANKFATVERQGLKAAVRRPSEAATRVPIDKLADIVLDLHSPQSIDELSRLVDADTFKQLGANAFSRAVQSATEIKAGRELINPKKLRKIFGIGDSTSRRPAAWARLLQGSGWGETELRTLVESVDKLADVPMPNVSTFIARGATIGGWQRIVSVMLPFTIAGTGAAGAGGAVGGLMFFLGSKGLVNALSDPLSARALAKVMDKEASRVVRRSAWLKVVRADVEGAIAAGTMINETGAELLRGAMEWARQLFKDPDKPETNQQ